MAKNLVTNDTYDSGADGLLNSTVQVKSPRRRVSRIIPSNQTFGVYIYRSPPSVQDDLQSKVAQILNNDTFIFGRDHNI